MKQYNLTDIGIPLYQLVQLIVLHVYYRCWMSTEKGAIWAFIGPMLMIILVQGVHTEYMCIVLQCIILGQLVLSDCNYYKNIQ